MLVVQREGVYGQGIVGIFSTEVKAMNGILEAIAKERDDYHAFSCYSIPVDVVGWWTKPVDKVLVFTVTRKRKKTGVFKFGPDPDLDPKDPRGYEITVERNERGPRT